MSSKAGKYTLYINQGETFDFNLNYSVDSVSTDLSGYSVRLHGREKAGGPIVVQFDNDLVSNGFIYLTGAVSDREDGANGNVRLFMTSANTSYIPVKNMKYTLEIESASNVVTRLLEGDVIVGRDFATSP